MEKHILSLIKVNNRVIVPNFGAFIVAKENGFTILFNNFLSFNDGLLVEHVMNAESVGKDQATEMVENYVDQVKAQLDDLGTYQIEGLGTFTKDASGILRFAQNEDINGNETTEKPAEAPTESKDEIELLDIDTTLEDKGSTPVTTKAEAPKPVAEPVVTPPKTEAPKAEASKAAEKPVSKPVAKPQEKPKPVTKKPASTYQYKDQSKNKSLSAFIILFVVLLLAGGAAIYFVFFHNKDKQPEVAKKEIVTPPVTKDVLGEADKNAVTAGPETKAPKEDKAAVVIPAAPAGKQHYIVVGSFKNTENADKFIAKLKGQGFEHCSSISHNSMTLVSLQSFTKLNEAYEVQEKVLESHRLESWILTKRN